MGLQTTEPGDNFNGNGKEKSLPFAHGMGNSFFSCLEEWYLSDSDSPFEEWSESASCYCTIGSVEFCMSSGWILAMQSSGIGR